MSATGQYALTSNLTFLSTTSTPSLKSTGMEVIHGEGIQDNKEELAGYSREGWGGTCPMGQEGVVRRGEDDLSREGGGIGAEERLALEELDEEAVRKTGVVVSKEMIRSEEIGGDGSQEKSDKGGGGEKVGGKGKELGDGAREKKKNCGKRKFRGGVKEKDKRAKKSASGWDSRKKEESGDSRDSEEDVEEKKQEERTRAGVRRERKSAGKAIAQALDRMGNMAQSIHHSKTELAIEKLQDEYALVLSTEDLVKAIHLMENEVKASVFVALRDGKARDIWLTDALNQM